MVVKKCHWDEKEKRIKYCDTFVQALADNHHNKGLVLYSIGSRKSDRIWSLPAINSGEYKNGVQVGYCPFDGTHLSPLVKQEQAQS